MAVIVDFPTEIAFAIPSSISIASSLEEVNSTSFMLIGAPFTKTDTGSFSLLFTDKYFCSILISIVSLGGSSSGTVFPAPNEVSTFTNEYPAIFPLSKIIKQAPMQTSINKIIENGNIFTFLLFFCFLLFLLFFLAILSPFSDVFILPLL